MSSEPTMHPTDETLAALAAGTIDDAQRRDALAHVEACDECMAALLAAQAFLRDDEQNAPGHRAWWLAIAAAILIAVIAVPLFFRRQREDDVARLVALAPRTERTIESRVSGGFAWAPYHGPIRSKDVEDDTTRLKLAGAAGELLERAQHDTSDGAQHAAATALILIERPADAIRRLEALAQKTPNDVRAWNDLAAARHAAALQLQRPSLLPEALAAADRALRIDPAAPEALFNRALILERMGLTHEARSAWERYLAVDPSSPWANEARQHLARLSAQTVLSRFQKELPRLERAAVAGDATTVAAIVAQFPRESRASAEAEVLGMWGEAAHRGDEAEAARQLAIARAVGAALEKARGESLLRDSVAAIDRADATQRATLAGAHRTYRNGRMAYAKKQLAGAEQSLREAAAQFAAAKSPMAYAARYYAASARYDRNEIAAACGEQAELLAELELHPRYAAMRAQIPWALALCRMNDADWNAAVPLLARAESGFRALGEESNRGFVLMLAASTYTYLGQRDDAWSARVRAFEAVSAGGSAEQLAVSLGAAARSEIREGRYEAARAMLQLEENADRAITFDAVLVDALVRQAVLNAATGDDEAANAASRDAESVARRVRDPELRARAIADAAFAGGAAALRRDPMRAHELLTSAIDAYRARELPVMLPEAYLLRARASMAIHDEQTAMRDLADGIAAIEKHPIALASGVVGTGVLDAGTALFEDAIGLQLDRGDTSAALASAERARAQLAAASDPSILQQRLAGTRTAVVEFVALPRELVAFVITANGITSTRTPLPRDQLEQRVASGDLTALHDLLIAPLALGDAQRLIVVPDSRLAAVPFHALADRRTRQALIERMPVSIALSATSLRRGETRAPRSMLVAALPTGSAAALPDVDAELRDVRDFYREPAVLASPTFAAFTAAVPRADVVHIAGHTARGPGAGDPALLFAGERISWQRIARARLSDDPTIVLSACETLRVPHDPRSRALSLGGGFIAAGAASVIGTLTPITDRTARDLFGAIHRHLAEGADAAEAVREAQLEAAARGDSAWKSIAVMTRVIPTEHRQEASHGRDHHLLHRNLHASLRRD